MSGERQFHGGGSVGGGQTGMMFREHLVQTGNDGRVTIHKEDCDSRSHLGEALGENKRRPLFGFRIRFTKH